MGITNFLQWIGSASLEDVDAAAKVIDRVLAERRVVGSARPAANLGHPRRGRPPASGGLRDLARAELARAGRQMTYQGIAAELKNRGESVNLESLRSTLWRMAKAGNVFSRAEDGSYGLLEWAEPSKDDDSARAEDEPRRFAVGA